MTQSTALAALLRLRPTLKDGNVLTADRLKVAVEEATQQANQIADELYARLESALVGGNDYLPALRKLLDTQK